MQMSNNNHPFKDMDFSTEKEYNSSNGITGKVVARIDRSKLVPIADTNHAHDYFRDGSEETDDYYAVVCRVNGCNLGQLISKH